MKYVFLLLFSFAANCIPAQTWRVNYQPDTFDPNAMLDLRYLNETTAGQNGFIKLSADGKGFVTSNNNQPIRFWATNGANGFTKNMTDAQLAQYARFLAKVGVNMIRYHGAIFSKNPNGNINDVDSAEIRNIWRVVAAMKKEGIYTVISPYWAGYLGFGNSVPASWGLGEYSGEEPWALMFFNSNLKNAYKRWVQVLYTENNPYTNIPLKDEPAVAIIQVKNEDSELFWTIQNIKPGLKDQIEALFFQWCITKYGSAVNAYTAWSNETLGNDNTTTGRFGIYPIWEATLTQSGGKAKRLADMVQFLTEHQRNFYSEIIGHYQTMGCRQITNANNWKTASAVHLNDAERWSNDVADVIAVNRYYDPGHIGDNSGWRIDPGHKYVGKSCLKQPEQLPINIKQIYNKPSMVTESGWNLPNKYQAEGPFLIAAYMSLTGVDGFFWFNPSSSGLDPYPYHDFITLPNGQKPLSRWTNSIPGQVLMMPANALLYRKGYITEGVNLVHEERKLTSLWERKIPVITEDNSFDPNRDNWSNTGNPTQTELPPISYLAGPVTVKYNAAADNKTIAANFNSLVNLTSKTVTSNTGQLKWNYASGVCTMDAPSAQGVAGFLKTASPTTQLTDVKIVSANEYAAINVVAMDDKPLKNSEKILIQTGTTYRPNKWAEVPSRFQLGSTTVDGFEITNTGGMPWEAVNTSATITIKNNVIRSAFLLDLNGKLSQEIYVKKTATDVTIVLPTNTMYLVLSTQAPTVTQPTAQAGTGTFNIYPNPAKQQLTLQIIDSATTEVKLFDKQGKLVHQLRNLTPGTYTINTAKFSSGIYCVTGFAAGKKKETKQLSVSR